MLPGTGHVGVTTSKSIGSRARRNRTKRRIREAARIHGDRLATKDSIVLGRNSAEKAPFEDVARNLGELIDELERRWEKQLESS
jgi:ribonuclease P protein component